MTSLAKECRTTDYQEIAQEYYDEAAHPTCADFRELSDVYVQRQISYLKGNKDILEVGAGRSSVAAHLQQPHQLDRLTLLDASAEMLSYSRHWLHCGAKAVHEDARRTNLPEKTFDVIVSCLGDPYNVCEFWQEARRLLRSGGICLMTTPSLCWAEAFREREFIQSAEFLVGGSSRVCVASFLKSFDDQVRMAGFANFRIIEHSQLYSGDIRSVRSEKTTRSGTYFGPVVSGWTFQAVD